MGIGLTGILAAMQIVAPSTDSAKINTDSLKVLQDSISEIITAEPDLILRLDLPYLSEDSIYRFPVVCAETLREVDGETYFGAYCSDEKGWPVLWVGANKQIDGDSLKIGFINWNMDRTLESCYLVRKEGDNIPSYKGENCYSEYYNFLGKFLEGKRKFPPKN